MQDFSKKINIATLAIPVFITSPAVQGGNVSGSVSYFSSC